MSALAMLFRKRQLDSVDNHVADAAANAQNPSANVFSSNHEVLHVPAPSIAMEYRHLQMDDAHAQARDEVARNQNFAWNTVQRK
eukprot:CAMPEP_0184295848 /NCGR_PEP_ID=MMETSP1049-20130417/6775_1 /TAXON_ID=77928 /ORGANISM="Proteomonas sulcata, Strain CCMP704" /LENGTH=83 /DNA_ID=CAMNT_0026604677 /DNA_START=90 /DNA_END=341 /DNA_ORIENTATION=+